MPRLAAACLLRAGPSRLSPARRVAAHALATQAGDVPTLPQASALPPGFAPLASKLCAVQPCFGVRGDNVELIPTPSGFHDRLLEMIKRARKRILISTLYIGVEEESLVGGTRTV